MSLLEINTIMTCIKIKDPFIYLGYRDQIPRTKYKNKYNLSAYTYNRE